MRRRAVALSILVAGAFGALAFFRSRRSGRAARVELFYADGSRLTLTDAEAAPLLAVADDVLRPV